MELVARRFLFVVVVVVVIDASLSVSASAAGCIPLCLEASAVAHKFHVSNLLLFFFMPVQPVLAQRHLHVYGLEELIVYLRERLRWRQTRFH